MAQVTLSVKYQIVIPKPYRKALRLRPGQKVEILQIGGRLELIPLRSLKDYRGKVKGIDTSVVREKDRL